MKTARFHERSQEQKEFTGMVQHLVDNWGHTSYPAQALTLIPQLCGSVEQVPFAHLF